MSFRAALAACDPELAQPTRATSYWLDSNGRWYTPWGEEIAYEDAFPAARRLASDLRVRQFPEAP